MNTIQQALPLLKRFPPDAHLEASDHGLYVWLHNYFDHVSVNGVTILITPNYPYDAPDEELPWLRDATWLRRHEHSRN